MPRDKQSPVTRQRSPPLVLAAASILATFVLLPPLTYLGHFSVLVEFLIALIGLGVAIDYSLLFVTRWREERHHGRDNHDAVVVAMETAGHAVLFSGVTVAIGLLALVALPPSLVSLFGSWNWHLPAGLAKLLRVQPSHAITPTPELGAVPIDAVGGKL